MRMRYRSYGGFFDVIDIITPGQIQDRATALKAEFDSFDVTIWASSVDTSLKNSWSAFRGAFQSFYENNADSWLDAATASATTGATDQLDAYQTQLRAWQESFKKAGGVLITPETQEPNVEPTGLDAITKILPWVIGLVVAVTVLPAVAKKI